jgi:hypothetical protein
MYNYSSKHGNELVSFHVPQVLQQLCDVDESVLLNLPAASSSVSIVPHLLVEEFLDDGCCDLFFSFLTTNQCFVVAMQKLQFHYDYSDILS